MNPPEAKCGAPLRFGGRGTPGDLQRPFKEGPSGRIVASGLEELGEVTETRRHIGVIGPQGLFPDLQRPLVQGLGPGIIPRGLEEEGEIVEARRHIRMVDAKGLLVDGKRLSRFRKPLSISCLADVAEHLSIQSIRLLEEIWLLGRCHSRAPDGAPIPNNSHPNQQAEGRERSGYGLTHMHRPHRTLRVSNSS